ncbi:MAG: protein kinase [bacterium]
MKRTAVEVRAGDRFGPYELVKQLAVGGMAEIYLAKATGISGFEKYVALKVIHPNYAEDEHFIEMLVEEAKITVHLTQPNIVQIFDLGRIGEVHFIAMEYVDGADLYHVMRTITSVREEVDFDVAAFIALETCAALDYAHRCTDQVGQPLGIIHRDISPQNIMISRAGEVKLADFGIAKATVRARQTAVGVIKGKYYYMSPEQAWGDAIDHRTDIFSTGVVLYEVIVGQMLYLEEDLGQLLDRVRKAEIAPPSSMRPNVPPALEAIVMKAVARRPDDRYQTAYDFQVALTHFLFSYSPNFNVQRLQALVDRAIYIEEQRLTRQGDGTGSEIGTARLGQDSLMSVREFLPLTTHSLLSVDLLGEEPTKPAHGLPSYDTYDDEETLISDSPPTMDHRGSIPAPSLPVLASGPGVRSNEWDEIGEPTTVQQGRRRPRPRQGLAMVRRPSQPAPFERQPAEHSQEVTRPEHPSYVPPVAPPAAGYGTPAPGMPAAGMPAAGMPAPGMPMAPSPVPQYIPVPSYAQPAGSPGIYPQQFQPQAAEAHPSMEDDAVERMLLRSRNQRHLILVGVLICVVVIGVVVFLITARSVTSRPGSVRVETIPTGAKVFYRGKYVGDTPHRLDSLTLDEVHWVRLESDRCESKAVKLEVEAGEVKTMRVRLENCEKQ